MPGCLLHRLNQPRHFGQQQQSSHSSAELLQAQNLLSILDKPCCPAHSSHGENISSALTCVSTQSPCLPLLRMVRQGTQENQSLLGEKLCYCRTLVFNLCREDGPSRPRALRYVHGCMSCSGRDRPPPTTEAPFTLRAGCTPHSVGGEAPRLHAAA